MVLTRATTRKKQENANRILRRRRSEKNKRVNTNKKNPYLIVKNRGKKTFRVFRMLKGKPRRKVFAYKTTRAKAIRQRKLLLGILYGNIVRRR
jgi:hypothetical protein